MRAVLSVFVVAACGSTPKPRVMPPPPEVVAKQAAPRWPVAMRVMTWTHDGVVQVGTLPEAPPTQPPATPWYVEPVRPMDDATFARLVVAMRRERVPGLSLRGQPVTAAWLAQLVDLDVTALVLDETDIDAAALAEIQLPLTRLYLARTRVDDAAMRWVATHPLEVIDIEGCAVGDVGLAALAEIATLRALNASSTRITDAGGAMLGKLARLEVVDLGRTEVGIKTIEALASRALSQLFVDKTRVGKAIAKLAAMAPTLVRFDASSLSGYRPTDVDVAWLARASNLVELGLSHARVTDRLVTAIAALPRLERVRLAGTSITPKGIDKLAAKQTLQEVDLGETAATDANAAALLATPALRILRLDKTQVGDRGLVANSGLLELYLSDTRVTDTGLGILDTMPALEALGLGRALVTAPSLVRIAKLSALRTLVLSGTRAPAESLALLGNLHALERLYLDQTLADSSVIAALDARNLRVLHLADTHVDDDALPALRTFALLGELTIGDSAVHAEIADLSAWPRLHTLSAVGLELGDAQLPLIARARRLERLDLSSTDVTDPAPLAALPNLKELGLGDTRLTRQGASSADALAKRGVVVVR